MEITMKHVCCNSLIVKSRIIETFEKFVKRSTLKLSNKPHDSTRGTYATVVIAVVPRDTMRISQGVLTTDIRGTLSYTKY